MCCLFLGGGHFVTELQHELQVEGLDLGGQNLKTFLHLKVVK